MVPFTKQRRPHPVATLAVLKRCERVTSTHGCTRMVYVQCQAGQVPSVELCGWPLVNTHGTVNHRRLFQFSERAICSQLSLISLSRPSQTFSTPDLLLRVRQGQLCSASPRFSQIEFRASTAHASPVTVTDCAGVTREPSLSLNCRERVIF